MSRGGVWWRLCQNLYRLPMFVTRAGTALTSLNASIKPGMATIGCNGTPLPPFDVKPAPPLSPVRAHTGTHRKSANGDRRAGSVVQPGFRHRRPSTIENDRFRQCAGRFGASLSASAFTWRTCVTAAPFIIGAVTIISPVITAASRKMEAGLQVLNRILRDSPSGSSTIRHWSSNTIV